MNAKRDNILALIADRLSNAGLLERIAFRDSLARMLRPPYQQETINWRDYITDEGFLKSDPDIDSDGVPTYHTAVFYFVSNLVKGSSLESVKADSGADDNAVIAMFLYCEEINPGWIGSL